MFEAKAADSIFVGKTSPLTYASSFDCVDFSVIFFSKKSFQIFRPRCYNGEKYCLSNKSCVPENETCDPTNKNTCQSMEIFCIYRRRCIANTTETRKTCAPLVPYQTDVPKADYELVSENRITIDTLGHHIKSLPIEEQPLVKQGDVLGWISEGGELAFRSITPADGAAFEFEYNSNPVPGEKLLRSSNPSMHHKHYIMAAHYVHAADFVIRHFYQSTGVKHLTSNVTQTVLVAIDIPVAGDVKMTHRGVVNTHEAVVFGVPWHSGSNVFYIWDFGDGNKLRTQVNSTNHTYISSGTYYVTLTVANSVNKINVASVIAVFDFIRGFKFSKPIEAKAVGLMTEIEWEAAEGTNITYVVDFGDGSQRYEKVTALEASRNCSTTHLYSAVGNYTVTVFAFNLVGPNISISSQALVEIPISEVEFTLPAAHVTKNVFYAVGDLVTVHRVVHNGTNVKCAFDFKDGTQPRISTQFSTTHIYKDTGTYKVEITCYNAVNSVTRLLNATIVIQNLENITGLTISAHPTTLGTDSEITVQMATGTIFFCTVSFGDSESLQIDFSHLGQILRHRYSEVGSYNTSVNCNNRLGSEENKLTLDVDIPIKDVTVTSDKRFIRVHENISVDVAVREGSRIRYEWDFSDGSRYGAYRTLAKQDEFESTTHAFTEDGNFPVKVTVLNSLFHVSMILPYTLVVEYPVANISLSTNSPIRLNPGQVTYHLSLLANVTPPTDAVCVWNFDDESSLTDSETFDISPVQPYVRKHTFGHEGIFTTSVNISNNVSSLVLSAAIDVQELKEVSITARRLEDGVLIDGFGGLKNFFRFNENVFFNVTSQAKDLSYEWDFADGSPLQVTSEPYTSHVYSRSATYEVRVTVDNILANMTATKHIAIEEPVGKISISSSYPTYKGDPTHFFILFEEPGTDSCLRLDFQDSSVKLIGEQRCRPPVTFSNSSFHELRANQTRINVTHTYGSMGAYPVKLTAYNTVSKKVASTLVNITSSPCDKPTVTIVGEDFKDPPEKIQKSEMLVLKHKVTYRCPVAASLVFTWSAFIVTRDNPNNESIPLQLPVDQVRNVSVPATADALRSADLIIKERKLPFAFIKFRLKLGFIGKDRNLSEIYDTYIVFIEVKRSDMSAVIRGME